MKSLRGIYSLTAWSYWGGDYVVASFLPPPPLSDGSGCGLLRTCKPCDPSGRVPSEGKLLPALHPHISRGVPVAPPIGSSFPPVIRHTGAASTCPAWELWELGEDVKGFLPERCCCSARCAVKPVRGAENWSGLCVTMKNLLRYDSCVSPVLM